MRRPVEPPRRRPRPLTWIGTAVAVATIQGLLAAALSWRAVAPTPAAPDTLLIVDLIPPPQPAPRPSAPTQDAPAPPGPSEPAPETPPLAPQPAPAPPVPAAARRTPLRTPPPDTPVLAVEAAAPGPPDLPLIGGARLVGALTAGGGRGAGAGGGSGGEGGAGQGGDCDMRARLEAALRGDARIRQATAAVLAARDARGQAVLVWNGDWLQSPGEAGKGLAGVRQAIAVEVGFAPRACRDQAVRGLVAIPLDADPAGPKLALGTGDWRWRDLLNL